MVGVPSRRLAQREDFRVTESGTEMPILSLQAPVSSGGAGPITVVLVVDHSRSMEEEDRIGSLKKAVGSFAQGLPEGLRRSRWWRSARKWEVICPFTSDFARSGRGRRTGCSPSGATQHLRCGGRSSAELLQRGVRPRLARARDGHRWRMHYFSQSATLDSAIASAVRLGLPVHTLGLGSEDEIESDALKKLATSTRGQYYPARQADQLRKIYADLAQRLRSSYSLMYRTDRKLPDGTLRPIRVFYRTSHQGRDGRVHARHGRPRCAAPGPLSSWGCSPILAVLAVLRSCSVAAAPCA